MIHILEALEWVNKFDISHINNDSRKCLEDSFRVTAKENEVRKNILQILEHSCGVADILDYPEALLNVGVLEFLRGWQEEAESHLFQAYALYHPRVHRRAVAAWILGIIEWRTRQNEAGKFHWREAQAIFTTICGDYVSSLEKVKGTQYTDTKKMEARERGIQTKVDWYRGILDRMLIEMSKKVEEIYPWLTVFEKFHLGESSQKIREIFEKKLANNLYPSANSLIQEIQKRSLDFVQYIETPEILIECSLAAYHTGNLHMALELVDKAISRFPPDSHCQTIARWMSGAMCWDIPSGQSRARRNWQTCIGEMEMLAKKADQENKQDRRSWYLEKKETMKAALADMLKEVYSDNDKVYYPNERG